MLIRPAEPHDALAVARVHVRSWQAAYRGLMPEEYLVGLRPEDRAARYDFASTDPARPHTQVATAGDAIVGFVTTAPSQDTDCAGLGELCALYVDPEHWGRGLGVALLAAGRKRLAAAGLRSALLWVLDGNEQAQRFYRQDGWVADGSRRTVTVWGVSVPELRYLRALTGSGQGLLAEGP